MDKEDGLQVWTRTKHAPSSKCLLCGDEDGRHHMASGCPALKRMYINRHNKLGRLIMTRVLRVRKGAFVIQMDLGSTDNCAEDGTTLETPHGSSFQGA